MINIINKYFWLSINKANKQFYLINIFHLTLFKNNKAFYTFSIFLKNSILMYGNLNNEYIIKDKFNYSMDFIFDYLNRFFNFILILNVLFIFYCIYKTFFIIN